MLRDTWCTHGSSFTVRHVHLLFFFSTGLLSLRPVSISGLFMGLVGACLIFRFPVAGPKANSIAAHLFFLFFFFTSSWHACSRFTVVTDIIFRSSCARVPVSRHHFVALPFACTFNLHGIPM